MAYPPPADQWWGLFSYFSTLGTIIGVIVITLLITLAIKYRYKPGKPDPEDAPKPGTFPKDRGHLKYLFALSFVTLGIISTLVVGSFSAFHVLTTPPDKGLDIEVTGFQWAWGFKYPNGVQTVSNLVVPVNQTIVFHVTSRDVKHKFGIPYFKTASDAIPGQVGEIWIKPTSTGNYDIRCYELCGVGHAGMVGTITVVSQDQFNKWLENATKK